MIYSLLKLQESQAGSNMTTGKEIQHILSI